MKINLTNISRYAKPFVAAAMALFVGCTTVDDEGEGEDESGSAVITVTNIDPGYNNVSFEISAEGANAISYYCALSSADAVDAATVIANGTTLGVSSGSYTISSLKSETDYSLYVVATHPTEGIVGPVVKTFTTQINTGAASSAIAAGIRITDTGTTSATNISWEVTNGDDVDFSLTMIYATVLLENYIMEAEKDGISAEDYMISFITTYGYLCGVTEGKGRSETFSYSSLYTSTPIFPGADYTAYSLAFSGDYDTYAAADSGVPDGITVLDITDVSFSTTAIPRIGNPEAIVTCTEEAYISLTHKVTPNSDAKYWGTFFTTTAEIDEFRDYYDAKEGEGMGDVRLRDFVMHMDADALVQETGESEWSFTVGFDMQGTYFSRLAVGLDDNFVVGDTYSHTSNTTIYQDNTTPADFDMEVHHIGAGNMFMTYRLGENCRQIYYNLVSAGSADASIADPEANETLGRELWDEGWVAHRTLYPDYPVGTELTYEEYFYGESQNYNFDVIACGLNNDGGISEVVKIGTYRTTSYYYDGTFEPALTIDVPAETVTKTVAVASYDFNYDMIGATGSDSYYNYYREYLHVILLADDAVASSYSDAQIAQYLWTYGNQWPFCYTYDLASFSWADLASGTDYVYIYASVAGDGGLSAIKKVPFSTSSNDGGANPYVTITVNESDVILNSADQTKYGAKYSVTPNTDVKLYYHLFFSQEAMESWWVDTTNTAELESFFNQNILTSGLPSTDATSNWEYETNLDTKLWVASYCYGADENAPLLSYVELLRDARGNVTIGDQVDVYTESTASVAPALSSASQSVNSVTRGATQPAVVKPAITHVASVTTPLYSADTPLSVIRQETGLPVYSMKELTLKALLRGSEKR